MHRVNSEVSALENTTHKNDDWSKSSLLNSGLPVQCIIIIMIMIIITTTTIIIIIIINDSYTYVTPYRLLYI